MIPMAKPHTVREKYVINVEVERQAIDLGCGKSVVSTQTRQHNSQTTQCTTGVREGVVETGVVADYLAGKAVEIDNKYVWCSPAELDVARLDGFHGFYRTVFDNQKTKRPSLFEQCTLNPQDALHSLVRVDHSSHMLFDVQEQPFPVAMVYDYVQNRISESDYDLQAVARTLLLRTDVLVMNASAKGLRRNEEYYSRWERALYPQEAIMNIPSYNCEEGRTQSVEFIWQPRLDDYRNIWDTVKNNQYPSSRLREQALSIFGLEEFASLKNRYHREKKPKL